MSRADLETGRWQRVRQAVLARDEYRCVSCGKAGKLECHHVISPLIDESLKHDFGNLETLCVRCHIEKHRERKEIPEELKQWREFLKEM